YVPPTVIKKELNKGKIDFHSQLSSENIIPPISLPSASGNVIFKINDDSTMIYYKITVKNLKNITQAEIHYGTNEYNGPIIFTMYPALHTVADSRIGRTFSGTLQVSTLQKILMQDGALKGGKIIDLIRSMKND